MTYAFGNARAGQGERLAALADALDGGTVRQLEAIGVGRGWRCLEVGAGDGSIAAWLSERVGADGAVVATDLDTTVLRERSGPNLEVRQHDVLEQVDVARGAGRRSAVAPDHRSAVRAHDRLRAGQRRRPRARGRALRQPRVRDRLADRDGCARAPARAAYASAPTATPGAPGMSSGHTGSRSLSCLAIWRAMTSRWISLAPS